MVDVLYLHYSDGRVVEQKEFSYIRIYAAYFRLLIILLRATIKLGEFSLTQSLFAFSRLSPPKAFVHRFN